MVRSGWETSALLASAVLGAIVVSQWWRPVLKWVAKLAEEETAEEGETWRLPSSIILLRHGESLGNVKESVYSVIPDNQIPLTETGKLQARQVSKRVLQVIGKKKVVIYYSPYVRTVETLDEILVAIPQDQLCIVQEEPRIREQDFGNFQDGSMKIIKKERARFGRFFYRFPEGESGADVYDRVCSFFETLFRQFKRSPISELPRDEDFVLLIVSHGLTIRLFLMRFFHWTVRDFERLRNPSNCRPVVLQKKEHSPLLYDLDEESWQTLGIEDEAPCFNAHFQFPVHYCNRRKTK